MRTISGVLFLANKYFAMNVPVIAKRKFSLKKFLKKLPWKAMASLLVSLAATIWACYGAYHDVWLGR